MKDSPLTSLAALGEPLRRDIYRYVASEPEPVNRDRVAERFEVARSVAAFHLDKLVDAGLLEVEYRRPPGRSGPGAGRPSKLYRRSQTDVAVSLPQREYELAGRLLAEAVTASQREGIRVERALEEAAHSTGQVLGQQVREAAGAKPTKTKLAHAALGALTDCGYEPRMEANDVVLANCPFHALAQDYRDLVCGMNLALVSGMTDEVEGLGLKARLDPVPGQCCVRLTRK